LKSDIIGDYKMSGVIQDLFGVDSETAFYVIGMAKYGLSIKELDQIHRKKELPP
jgi:hypothetical protein